MVILHLLKFKMPKYLTFCDISYNLINSFNCDKLINLKYLKLSNNNLEKIVLNDFANLENLIIF